MIYYYTSDGSKFDSKLCGIEYANKKNQHLHYYYYDHVYDSLDWTREPSESLDHYYKIQAQRIRDEYEYVVLAYSGGYDSTNILETFHYNGLKLDKIITVGALSQDSHSGVDENHNGELYHNVFPYIKELGLESITEVWDYTKLFTNVNQLSISQYANEWVKEMAGWYSPHNWFWYDIEKFVIPDKFKDKKTCIIFGRDKPSLFYAHKEGAPSDILANGSMSLNGFYFRDNPVTSYGNVQSKGNCDRINFYWDPKSPEILIKQLHLLYKVYSIHKTNSYAPEVGVQLLSGIDVNSIIYNLKKPILFKSPKSKNGYMSLRDTYMNTKQNSQVYDLYASGMRYINSRIDPEELTAPIRSKYYYVI